MNEFTVKEYAAMERVSVRAVQRWIEKGAIQVRRTPGGRIRIPDQRARVVFITTNDDEPRRTAE